MPPIRIQAPSRPPPLTDEQRAHFKDRCGQDWQSKVFFNRNTSVLSDDAAEQIVDLAAGIATACKPERIEVAGHRDATEDAEISNARALEIKAALVRRHLDANAIAIRDFGSSQLLAQSPDVRNRRATISFRPLKP